MIKDQFLEIYNRNKLVRDSLKTVLNNVLPTVDFSKSKRTYRFNNENKGVEINLFGKWVWSWMNTINTNYSCLYLIIDEINKREQKKILARDLESNTKDVIDYFENYLEKNKQTLFTPGSDIFKNMFFTTQMTWNRGLISVISGLLTISKHFDVENFNLEYYRGQKDDMTKGCDLVIYFDGQRHNTQHKIAHLIDRGGYYLSYNFIYNENIYRNHVDLISIESENKIHLFHNSQNKNTCGVDERGNFRIYKTHRIKEMHKEKQEVSDLLLELNKICFNKRIIFEFEKGNGKENYFEDKSNNNIRTIRLFLNNLEDENLSEKIKSQIEKLK